MIRVKELHLLPILVVGVLTGMAILSQAGPAGSSPAPPGVTAVARTERLEGFVLDTAGTRIWFQADATLGEFEGRATRFSGWADVSDTLNFAGTSGHVEIEVASFKTGNGRRDGHLRGDMKADKYPLIVFENRAVHTADVAVVDSQLAGIVPFSDAIPAARIFLEGTLTVRDSTRDVRIPARVRISGDTIRVRGKLATRFTDFGMKPPTRILGTVKVKDDIVLLFDALFRRSPS